MTRTARYLALIITSVVAWSVPAAGDDADESAVHGQVAVGFAASSGNTDNSNLNASILLGYRADRWRHTLNLVGRKATDSGSTIAERYQATGKSDMDINEDNYLFVTVQFEADRFAGFDRRTSEAIGYGRHIFETDSHRLDMEAGIGGRQTRLTDGSSENDAILRLAGDYSWTITETTDFTQNLVIMSGRENTFTESVSALNTRLVGRIHSIVSFTVKRNDTVLPGRSKTDTHTAVQLEYRF